MKTALTIAGSDSSGGAGIQADIKTMTANGVFATCAVTALTAQNTTGVTDILESTPHFLAEQLDAVFTDIAPDAVKIGMVSSAALIAVIAEKLRRYGAQRVVVDPVMVWRDGGGKWFRGRRIPNPNTHGTGCTLSSAIAANLAKGYDLDQSVERAKAYISGALAAMLDLGKGSGPMNHMFDLKGGFAE